jgi:lysozyme family protein
VNHFDEALKHLLKAEGGLKEHKPTERIIEAGGAANFGITVLSYLSWKHKQGELLDIALPNASDFCFEGVEALKRMTKDECVQFYRDQYGVPMWLDQLDGFLTCVVLLDQAVNRGKGGVKKALVHTMNKRYGHSFTLDTKFAEYIPALNALEDRQFFWQFLSDAQDNYVSIVKSDPTRLPDLSGWMNRTQNLFQLLV